MEQRTLGRDGADVSVLGIGAMSFSDFYGETSDENSYAVLDAAMEAGVTHVDTSNIYGMGRSEAAIGAYLSSRGQEARDHFVIATKAGITRDADGARVYDNSAAHLEAELDGSLRRLGVECVDLFYVHRREADRPVEEVAETLAMLVRKGKTKSVGFSEIAPSTLRRAHAVHPVAAVQTEYSLQTRQVEMGVVQACEELGVAMVAFSPVGRSLLTDRPLDRAFIETNWFLKSNPRFMSPNYEANLAQIAKFQALAAEMGMPAAALAVAWVAAQGRHVLPIPGTRSVAHFAELVAGAEAALTAQDLARIEEVLPIGWCHGERYSREQSWGPEGYC